MNTAADTTPEQPRRHRAYRFTLSPTDTLRSTFAQHAGAARWAYNYAHSLFLESADAFAERVRAHIEREHGHTTAELAAMPAAARRKLEKAARKIVKAESADKVAQLKLIDEHRKRLTHKGKPTIEPGDEPSDPGSTAHEMWRERTRLAKLHTTNPAAYTAERKAALADIRPQVNRAKRTLISEGAIEPTDLDISTQWRMIRDLPKEEGGSPWWESISVYAMTSAFTNTAAAWKNWRTSATGDRAGRRMGRPRFKKKGRSADSFTLYGATRLATYRRLNLPGIGEVRLNDSGKRLSRALKRGGIIKSVTVSRGAHRWYASVLVDEPDITPGRENLEGQPSRAQRARGRVGVNLGVRTLAALSNGELIHNPRYLDKSRRRLVRQQRSIARSERGSARLAKKNQTLARLHHAVAEQRKGNLHQITKRLTTNWAEVALQDLDVVAMTASARGTVDNPGVGVKRKARLNRAVLDAAFGEFRRQISYKTGWYGSTAPLADRYEPVDQTCAHCGATKAKLPLSVRVYHCGTCGVSRDRDHNAALNIAATARHVAPDSEETQNARGGTVSPPPGVAGASETGRPSD